MNTSTEKVCLLLDGKRDQHVQRYVCFGSIPGSQENAPVWKGTNERSRISQEPPVLERPGRPIFVPKLSITRPSTPTEKYARTADHLSRGNFIA